MVKVQYAIINIQHRIQIAACLAQHRKGNILCLFGTDKQPLFFYNCFNNCNLASLDFSTFSQYMRGAPQNDYRTIIIMDVPQNFETLQNLLAKIQQYSAGISETVLLLPKQNKKYINIAKKKVEGIQFKLMEYSTHKFIGVNDKLQQLVQTNYQINRQGFYAYGSYINYVTKNMLKTIFNTSYIDVNALAKGFGFSVAPRVKQGHFLNEFTRKKMKNAKRIEKIKRKKQQKKQAKLVNVQEQIQAPKNIKGKKLQKVSSTKIAKKKKIIKK